MTTGNCIETPKGTLDKDGYPRVKYDRRLVPVHRLIMLLLYGDDALEGKLVCHTCNNRSCVNPEHLYIGDPLTNSNDKYLDGTMPMGKTHHNWKEHVDSKDLATMYHDMGMPQSKIALIVGMSQSSVSKRIKDHTKELNR